MASSSSTLDMSSLPPVFILPTHLQTDDLHEAEDTLHQAGGQLSYRAAEARIFLSKISHKRRATFDLRARGLWTQEAPLPVVKTQAGHSKSGNRGREPTNPSSRLKEQDDTNSPGRKRKRSSDRHEPTLPDLSGHIVVLKLEWLEDCIQAHHILPFESYVVYTGKIIEKPTDEKTSVVTDSEIKYIKAVPERSNLSASLNTSQDRTPKATSILERAQADAAEHPSSQQPSPFHRRKFGQKHTSPTFASSSHRPNLYRATTSELEQSQSKLPRPPSWVSEKHPRPMYSCLRSTFPLDQNPNRHFIAQLTKIKEARLLNLDEIGVRAYSTSIASLSAYTHRITSPTEITRLPGCNDKIAMLWVGWYDSVTISGSSSPMPKQLCENNSEKSNSDPDAMLDVQRTIPATHTLSTDTDLTHLRTFFNIWGVGAETARKFYFTHGWKDMDDVIEFGWSMLTRVQQIGVKFYDEFQQLIPRLEVESIARTILHHARLCRPVDKRYWTNDVVPGRNGATTSLSANESSDPRDFVAILVGGYRRGKPESGDVDVILSHRDERMTQDLVVDVVQSLEAAGFVTHTLTLHTTTSDRGQQTLPYRADGGGHGFDSLDKALCVWQDPKFEPGSASATATATATGDINPNIHRRVDIIVSPWRTVGCAVLGWSGGTTFQRDIRRWVKREHGWKFDSSGVRDRGNGLVLDLESPADGDLGDGWEDRERRLMERMGIGWRPAVERCTG